MGILEELKAVIRELRQFIFQRVSICCVLVGLVLTQQTGVAQQKKFLFDATKAEMAGNADWVIDADIWNLGVNSTTHRMQVGLGNESNPQRIPTPSASGITGSTPETYWKGALSSWAIVLVKMGYAVETLSYDGVITYGDVSNPQDLSNYQVFVVCEPNILFTAAEKTAMLTFVQNGGGLFMVSDHNGSDRNNDGQDSPHIWNDLMQTNSVQANPFGITFNYDDISPNSSEIDTTPADSLIHGPAGAVSQLIYNNGASITINNAANATVAAAIWTASTHTNSNIMCAFARFGSGRVVGIGDSSPCDDGTGDTNDNLFVGWTDAGGNHGKLFTNASVWLAGPTQQTFSVSATSGSNGAINPGGVVTVNSGANQSFTISPNTGYHIDSLVVDGANTGTGSNYTFTNVTANHTIRAVFAINQYTIVASTGSNGSISPTGTITVNYSSNKKFTVTPNTGYHVDSLVVDGTKVDSTTSYTFMNVIANHAIRAVFAINQYTISSSAGSNGTVLPLGSVAVSYGANQTFTITSSTNYHVDSVIVDGAYIGSVTTHTFNSVTANHSIRATFAIDTYAITASAGIQGAINPSGSIGVVTGANQAFTISANAHYHVDSVVVDGNRVDSTTSYTFYGVTASHTIRSVFAIDQYTINASAGSGGTISPNGEVVVNYGSNQTFTFSPAVGHHVDSLVVDGAERDSITSYTFFSVTSNHTIQSYFGTNQYSIVATAGQHGMISPAGTVSVTFGGDQTFTITPDSSYEIGSLHVDGLLVTPTTSYEFTNISSNHTIGATFELPTVIRTISMIDGWNIISVPLTVADARTSSLFPDASSAAYGFDQTQGYVVRDTLQNSVGYWLKFPSAQNDSIRGGIRNQDSLTVYPGWNLIGSISNSVVTDSIIQIPPGIVLSNYYRYSGTYSSADTLQPGNAYWVKVSQNGRLVLK